MAARGRRSSQLPGHLFIQVKYSLSYFLHVCTLGSFSVLGLIAFLTHVDKTLCLSYIPNPILLAQISSRHTTSRLNTSHFSLEIMMCSVSLPWFPI